jgi:hypothetical protein
MDLKHPRALLLNPADQIHVQYKPSADGLTFAFDGVLDIIEIAYKISPEDGKVFVSVICSDLHGWKDNPGWWTTAATTLPTFLQNMAGYGSGAIKWNKNWARQIKDYARQAYGYWTQNGDADSFIPSSWI